jgi:hypothetical protein
MYNNSIVMKKDVKMNVSVKFDSVSGKFVGAIDGKVVVRSVGKAYVERRLEEMAGSKIDFVTVAEKQEAKAEKFGINARFGFVEKLVSMVADNVQPSAVITGEGGLGKTFTVTKTLETKGYKDISDLADFEVGTVLNARKCFTMVKGYSTAKGLYRTLFENNKSIIVFDDCDAVLKDPVALNLLKSALDSYGKRIISWNADMRDDDLPRSFNFEGRVIFISNMTQDKIDQAIRSRSMMIDLSMTMDQKIDRMEFIAQSEDFLPEYDAKVKTDALGLIRELKDDVKEVSLRTLIAVSKIRAANSEWKDLATYMLTA